ncbi:MAG: beta-galactosidase [Alphaproteobacteria bacterium]
MKPALGVCYYPEHWQPELWEQDAQRMVAAGILWVRIGEFAWSQLEPSEGKFDWDWLDQAVGVLAAAGLHIIMGTPSATPPRWVISKYPDMLAVDDQGRERKFGSRRHYCFSHLGYRREAARMAGAMAQRYGKHKAVKAWQIDNEYGCHETVISHSNAARSGFQEWLSGKYQSPDALNRAWGNIFWSMAYADFSEIDLPNLTVTEANPSHQLDFRRYASDQVIAFNQAQIAAMRPHTARPFIHNYMGRVTDFDHFKLGKDLEIASWDSYPLGFLEQVLAEEDEDWKAHFSCQGDPDFQAFHHDLYRAVGKGRWWVMEQQPGPVNWAPYNPIPLDGMVKLWSMEAIAHGAEVISYFRWRQAPFAQEQMHAGLLRPDHKDTQGLLEAKAVADELQGLGDITHCDADIAIIFDYESQWAWEIQPQGKDFDYFRLVFEQYRALRSMGLNVDILPANVTDFGVRKLVLIPGLMTWNDSLKAAIDQFDGAVLAGPRTGLKTQNMHIPDSLGPDFAGVTTARVHSMRPNISIPLEHGGNIIHWFEQLEGEGDIILKTLDDRAPVLVRDDVGFYLGAWLDQAGYVNMFKTLCDTLDIPYHIMPKGVRRRAAADKLLILNYNPHAADYEGDTIPAASYIWK